MHTRLNLGVLLLITAIFAPHCFANDSLDLDVDFDGDGIINRFDNCHINPNPSQFDSDSDGYGNICDADLNNDGVIDFEDLSIFSDVFATADTAADFNEDGAVNFLDLRIFRGLFANGIPGPPLVMRWVGGSGSWSDDSNWLPARAPRAFLFEHAIIDTPEEVTVTIEGDSIFGTRTLELNGNLRICGEYTNYLGATVVGTVTVDGDCGIGRFSTQEGSIDLDGTINLQSGSLFAPSINDIGDVRSKITVNGISEIAENFSGGYVETDTDIFVNPGAKLLVSVIDELVLNSANIFIQSEPDLPAVIEISKAITGTGVIEFSGPPDESATGELFTFNTLELGADIDVQVAPGAYASFDGLITNLGTITVEDSATLFFGGFSLFYNSGEISCNTGSGLRVFPSANPFPSDNILFNNESGILLADDCAMTWPTRVINDGSYLVSSSQINMPLIGSNGVPVQITDSDIIINAFQPPVPADFFIFDPANDNTVQLDGIFDLGDQTLVIDAAKWRFNADAANGARFDFGTLVSQTPLNVNEGARLTLFYVNLQSDLTLEPASYLKADRSQIKGDIQFLEPVDCQLSTAVPAVFELAADLDPSTDSTVSAVSSNDESCLTAEFYTVFQSGLPDGVNFNVADAALRIYSEGQGFIELNGTTSVSGTNGSLTLEQVTNSGSITCSEGATLNALGSSTQPFENSGSIVTSNCDVSFEQYWSNSGSVATTQGALNLSGAEAEVFAPGAGTFSTNFTDVNLNLNIDDLSTLGVFNVNGGTFTVAASILDSNPVIDLDLFPDTVQFTTGFDLIDKTIVGTNPLLLTGTTTLQNVVLAADAFVLDGAVVNVLDQLTLDDSSFTIQSESLDDEPSSSTVEMDGAMNIFGTGTLTFAAHGANARSELIQTVADMPISIDAGIKLVSMSDGSGIIRAGENTGTLSLFGPITVAGQQANLNLESPSTLFGKITSYDRGQLRIVDSTLAFSGPDSGLVVEVRPDISLAPGIVAAGESSIDISEASLALIPGPDYQLESDKVITVMEHSADASRVGEFANTADAVIEGETFVPDYSSPDSTVFRGPTF